LGNRNAPGAHIQQQIGVPIFENYEDENDEGNQIEMVFSDVSSFDFKIKLVFKFKMYFFFINRKVMST
jgi:hypothetical protein